MKKNILLPLALVLCLTLCACGKSEAVKNVETMIGSIGEVTLDSQTAIDAAQAAYTGLSAEDQEQVENRSVLSSARAQYTSLLIDAIGEVTIDSEPAILAAESAYQALSAEEKALVANSADIDTAKESFVLAQREQALLGTWCFMPNATEVVFQKENTVILDEGMAEYSFLEDGIRIQFFGMEIDFIPEEVNGITILQNPANGILVRKEDYQALYDMIFVTVDLSSADINDYAEFIHLDYTYDSFGEKLPGSTYLIASKVYDQGLIYCDILGSHWDVLVEYGRGSAMHGGFPFGQTCSTPQFGRMKGTITFIRSEYVDEYIYTSETREVKSRFIGISAAYAAGMVNYPEYPY